ncbi:MAG: hypothetical protein DMF76_27795 [Acidobacteria bacterium]|nr:MAG: hypothetical protein DMF76_27795 [Acidobacteriota bacterium]
MSAAKFTEDNKENEALARSERNFATFVSFRLAASDGMFSIVQKTVRKHQSFAEADKADRDFYKALSGKKRLNILLQLSKHEPERRLERVCRITKFPRR